MDLTKLKQQLRNLEYDSRQIADSLDELADDVGSGDEGLTWPWAQLTHDEQVEVVATIARRVGLTAVQRRAGWIVDGSLLAAASES